MGKLWGSLTELAEDRGGITAVEYAIVAGVLCVLILSAFQVFGTQLSTAVSAITL